MTIISEDQLKHRFSLNMRHFMAEKSITENELSRLTEISQSAINRIKNGHVCPSLHQALLIAGALENKLNNFFAQNSSAIEISNYIPVLSATNLLDKELNILGFIKNNMDWKKNIIGLKVETVFNCKLLNNESIVVTIIDDKYNYIDGDTILFLLSNKFMIGTIHKSLIKPIDNLSMQIEVKKSIIIGKVINIQNKYLKNKATVLAILKKFNVNNIKEVLYFLLGAKGYEF